MQRHIRMRDACNIIYSILISNKGVQELGRTEKLIKAARTVNLNK